MTTPCLHAAGAVLVCARCMQTRVDPPPPPRPRATTAPTHRRPKAWRAILPDGRNYSYVDVPLAVARDALRRELGRRRAPRGVTWEPL